MFIQERNCPMKSKEKETAIMRENGASIIARDIWRFKSVVIKSLRHVVEKLEQSKDISSPTKNLFMFEKGSMGRVMFVAGLAVGCI